MTSHVHVYVRACARVYARACILKILYVFWTRQPACSLSISLIRRKVRPLVYSMYNTMSGATFPPPATCPTVVSLLAPLCPLVVAEIAPLIEYTYANFPADIAIVIYFSLVAAILMCPHHEEMSPSRSPLRNVFFATLGSLLHAEPLHSENLQEKTR